MTDSLPENPDRPRRRWFQFRLRTLLAAVVVCSAALALWNIYVEPYRRQQRTIARILKIKGSLATEAVGPAWLGKLTGGGFFADIINVDLSGIPVDAGLAAELVGLRGLRELNLIGSRITDQAMPAIGRLDRLTSLSLGENSISDAGLAHLAGLTQLSTLGLNQTQITDRGLQHLAAMTRLRVLELDGTAVSDAGIRHLLPLRSLRALSLRGTQVTDAGVHDLTKLRELQNLFLDDSLITPSCLADLKKLLKLRWLTTSGTPILPPAIWRSLPRVSDPRLARALAEPTSIEFVQSPLKDIVDYLKDLHRIPIEFDRRACLALGIVPEIIPVTFNEQKKNLGEALKTMLEPYGLRVSKRYDFVAIEPRRRAPASYQALTARGPISARLCAALHGRMQFTFHRVRPPNLLDLFRERTAAKIQCDADSVAKVYQVFQFTDDVQQHSFASRMDLLLQEADLAGIVENETLCIVPRPVGKNGNPVATGVAGESTLASEKTLSELNRIADNGSVDQRARANAIFAIFANYLRPPKDRGALKSAIGSARWLRDAEVTAIDQEKTLVPLASTPNDSIFRLLSVGKGNWNPWTIYLRLSGGNRTGAEAWAFLRGDEVPGDPQLLEFALCFPDDGIEQFTAENIEIIPPRYNGMSR